MPLTKGQRLSVRIEASSPSGDAGVALVDECRIEVPGLFVGEEADIALVHVGKSKRRAWGKMLALKTTHPGRREAPCRHQHECGGCPWMVLEEESRHAMLRQRSDEILGFPLRDLIADVQGARGYRHSSKRVAFQQDGALKLGSYQRGSHAFAAMSDCLVDHPRIAEAARFIEAQATRLGIRAWAQDKDGHVTGELRYVWFKTDGENVLVTLVTGEEQSQRIDDLAQSLDVAGVAWCVHGVDNNVMRPSEVKALHGASKLEIQLCDTIVSLGPLGFLQPNPQIASRAYRELIAGTQGSLAFDLYAGAGVTTAMLKQSFHEVRASESNPESAAALGIQAERVETFLRRQQDCPELIVANPPRAGLGEAVCTELLRLGPTRLHIMSCNPRSMRRDLDMLLVEGGFEVDDALGFDTLPQTPHIELVVKLRKTSTPTTNEADAAIV